MILWHKPGRSRFVNREPGHKVKQDLCNSRNVKFVWALRMGTGRAFHKAVPVIEEALDSVLVIIWGTTIFFFCICGA